MQPSIGGKAVVVMASLAITSLIGFPKLENVLDCNAASVAIGAGAPSVIAVARANSAGPSESSAEGAPSTVSEDDLPGIVESIFKAVADRDWMLLLSAMIMLLVFVANKIWISKLDSKKRAVILPWSAVVSACLIQFAASLANDGALLSALLDGFVTGAGAAGLWSLLGKHMLKQFAQNSSGAP